MLDKDVLGIELLHPLDQPPQFFQRLQDTMLKATAMQGTTAFYTFAPEFVTGALPSLLSGSGSFFCVDIHPPTSIDLLDDLTEAVERLDPSGSHIYLHLRDLQGQSEVWLGNRRMPDHLLHSKALLFDLSVDLAEVWIGSHNWTRRAMVGLNIEATTVVTCSRSSSLYRSTAAMLSKIRDLCEPFDRRLTHYYKWLQGLEAAAGFFELEGVQADTLTNSEIKIFGDVPAETSALSTLGKKIYVSVIDSDTAVEYLYRAEISTASDSSVDIDRLSSGLMSSNQRYVYRQGLQLPRLEVSLASSAANPINGARYCGTINVLDRLPANTRVYEPLQIKPWHVVSDDPLFEKLRSYRSGLLIDTQSDHISSEYVKGVLDVLEKVKLRLPTEINREELRRPYERSLEDKRADLEHPLYTRKIVEFTDPSGQG